MRLRFRILWERIQSSLWFIPGTLVAAALALAVVLVRLDIEVPTADDGGTLIWIFQGGAEGARGVLAAIAGSMVTVAATVFSIVVVALTLASQQFTPRILRNYMRDRWCAWSGASGSSSSSTAPTSRSGRRNGWKTSSRKA
jgi:uncharacterized membrane protein